MSERLSSTQKVVILGAGPCGLGAASELYQSEFVNWHLYEQSDHIGGLASTLKSPEGFLFDIGGHVIFSHYKKFDAMADQAVPEWLTHKRSACAYMRNRFVPYPIQRHIGYLPQEDIEDIIKGVEGLPVSPPVPNNFDEWLKISFGKGLYDLFMSPYNIKVWGYPLDQMNCHWVGERVAIVDLQILKDSAKQKTADPWGPNAHFRYPLYDGTGALWTGLGSQLPPDKVTLNSKVVSINPQDKQINFSNGHQVNFDILISTLPLDMLTNLIRDKAPGVSVAGQFKFSSTHVIGIGIKGQTPSHLKDKNWIYFPEENVPFYRGTVLSNYSPHLTPDPEHFWSLLLEVAETPYRPLSNKSIADEAVSACRMINLIPADQNIASILHRRFERGYPTPFLERDRVVDPLIKDLAKISIFSRGRFGAWKYEVSNQDHSYMQGVEVVRHLLYGEQELTLNHPQIVNSSHRI